MYLLHMYPKFVSAIELAAAMLAYNMACRLLSFFCQCLNG
jgi:hypothetical protein